mmetsp:Transcript_23815/g.66069  ORF Transcript_23815/g.66069 Transcript_23815/m.66069 type:complete len:184 (-) Transcript_23815:134-685(-)
MESELGRAMGGVWRSMNLVAGSPGVQGSDLRLQNLEKERMNLQQQMEYLEGKRSEAESALRDQNEKSQRATRNLQKLRTDMRRALGASGDSTREEVDMQLAEVREINGAMLEELRSLAETHPELDIPGRLGQVGVQLPAARGGGGRGGGITGSRTPSRASSSAASETSSMRSVRRAGTVQIGL